MSEKQALTEFEARLRQLEPLPGGLARDRLLYEAGRRAAGAPRFWPAATALLALLCLAMSVRLLLPPPAPPLGGAHIASAAAAAKADPKPAPVLELPAPRHPDWDHLSLGYMQEHLPASGGNALATPASPMAPSDPTASRRPMSILEIEAQQFPRAQPAPIWPAWLRRGGRR
jgi:hypothetical protein